ncbi:MAG: hypothetical protein IJK60_03955 [Clostridia bacterium]|nr:hypothetical protein [Clostridia bacterium]MBR0120623.1 hypothetical protein [Clostridia bacterium]
MKKLTAFILITALLFSFCASVPVSAQDIIPADDESKEQDIESELQPVDVYYITQKEFEKYRDDYFAEKPISLSDNLKESILLFPAGLITPLMLPILIFIPWGGFVVSVVLAAPYIVTSNLFNSAKEFMDFNLHKDELYNSFSTDNMYVLPEYSYDETYSEIIGINYNIQFKDASSETPANAIPVAIKNN